MHLLGIKNRLSKHSSEIKQHCQKLVKHDLLLFDIILSMADPQSQNVTK